MDPTPTYPEHRVADVVLRDGATVRVRPVVAADGDDVVALFARLSAESRALRFHADRRVARRDVERFVDVDYRDTFGLVAETAAAGGVRVVALANYLRTGADKAEVAIAIEDAFQSRGLGSIMLEHLAEAAVEAKVRLFEAEVMASNRKMIDVVTGSRLPAVTEVSMGSIHMEFPTSPTPEAIDAFERREAVAAAAGVRAFLEPRSVAVVGASRRRGTIGAEMFRNLLDGGFNGPVYPVNPKAGVVQSVVAYPSVLDVPGPVDLAVIVVPAREVLGVAAGCAAKGVKALVVISSGFAEVGEQGRTLQNELLKTCRDHGMRMVGPNCMGVMNLRPDVSMDATFAPRRPRHGALAFSSQSGALGIAIIDRVRDLGLGMSSFVSVGNKADISGNDLLHYWEQDPDTRVILLYLESFGNPRKFARIARRVSQHKPIVAVKSGRSEAGVRAAASHTGSLAAGDVAVDALFRQAGVIRTDSLEELFDVASLLSRQPLPPGGRVGILTNAGGLGILCADACQAAGLTVPSPTDATAARLRSLLAAEASVANPIDMIASATAEQYEASLEAIADDPNIDAIVVIFIEPLVTRAEDVAEAVARAAARIEAKPLLACFLGVRGIDEKLQAHGAAIPTYRFPEDAARALGRVGAYARWRDRPEGEVPDFPDVDRAAALALASELLAAGERWLEPGNVVRLLGHYGITMARTLTAPTAQEVPAAAARIARPVAVKIDSRTITHKSDVGGVRLNLTTPEAAGRAAQEIVERLGALGLADDIDRFVVQEMVVHEGAEMYVGVTHDPLFGPLIACGAGGVLLELMRDVSVRITPLTDLDARDMLRALRAYPMLTGYRGMPPLDARALEDVLLRLSAMVEDLPQIAELDLNPILVKPDGDGCIALDARIRVAPAAPPRPLGARTVTTPSDRR